MYIPPLVGSTQCNLILQYHNIFKKVLFKAWWDEKKKKKEMRKCAEVRNFKNAL